MAQAHHLFGVLTCEERRACMAASILKEMGCEGELRAALAAEASCEAQGRDRVRAPTPPPPPKVCAHPCMHARALSLVLSPLCSFT
eukprot:1400617-Pleurochrysis_carterae.AAC.2